ncbi:Aconitate hydratase 1 [Moraxella caprae]|uniref:aconitate hydratase n=1 Tax=Moraxella caprae TaxID=90240 RepID=A0A378R2A6_9GAMM|nr:Aconitate hydratase 1 [Moraxella caprae]
MGDRATTANMTPEYGATAGLFYIDQNTLDYLTLTGRESEQVKLVENYAKTVGLWADKMTKAVYPRVLEFDLSAVTRNIAGPSNPHAKVATSELKERGIAGVVENRGSFDEVGGLMPDGAVIIAAITSCTNTSNPRNTVAAGLLAKKPTHWG